MLINLDVFLPHGASSLVVLVQKQCQAHQQCLLVQGNPVSSSLNLIFFSTSVLEHETSKLLEDRLIKAAMAGPCKTASIKRVFPVHSCPRLQLKWVPPPVQTF
mmetsp:Transcript_11973/g.18506  ORF Transcript_11973/g.18506 Transcript_11973/m.18506 type:complete len:103 (-) Transcript_11973:146-454(-)